MFWKAAKGMSILITLCVVAGCGQVQPEASMVPIAPSSPQSPASPSAPSSAPSSALPSVPPGQVDENLHHQIDREQMLYQFITDRLMGSDGVWTNYRDTDQNQPVATGHEVLSESAGLMLRYLALTGQEGDFETEWARTKQIFELSTGFSYRFSPKLDKRYSVNAAVDDLRIIRALHEAGEAFKDDRYLQEADNYGERFYQHNVKNGYLYDFYDETYKMTNDFITLCYIDFRSLQLLPITSGQKQQLMDQMQEIAKNGYLGDEFPFYETRFHYDTKTYSSKQIQTVESLLTILSLAEVGQHQQASINYLKEHVKAGTLFGQYSRDGKPANDIQSTAIYAITAMIGAELGDNELYEDSMRRMNQFQVQDADSPLYGGFGYAPTEEAYSFDNLMALLAYAYEMNLTKGGRAE